MKHTLSYLGFFDMDSGGIELIFLQALYWLSYYPSPILCLYRGVCVVVYSFPWVLSAHDRWHPWQPAFTTLCWVCSITFKFALLKLHCHFFFCPDTFDWQWPTGGIQLALNLSQRSKEQVSSQIVNIQRLGGSSLLSTTNMGECIVQEISPQCQGVKGLLLDLLLYHLL